MNFWNLFEFDFLNAVQDHHSDMKIKVFKNFSYFFITVFLAGCATKNVEYSSTKQEGQWEAKAQIRNFKDNTTKTVNMDVMAIKDRALRMEVSATLGIQVASVLMKNKNITILVHPQKRALIGVADEKSLEAIIKTPINPQWLYGAFFDSALEGWDCEGDPVSICKSPNGEMIKWTDRDGEKKRITIECPQYTMQILVKNYQTKVQSPDKAFNLEIPETYKKFKIN